MLNDTGSARRGSNFDPDIVQSFVARVETLTTEKKLLKDAFKESTIKPIDDDIAEIIKEADKAGVPPKMLRAALKKRKLEADAGAQAEKFEGDARDEFEALLLALGELAE